VFKDFVVPGDDPRTFSKYFLNILADFKPGEEPTRPEAAALFRKRGNRESPSARCMPHGIPQGDLDNYLPLKIVQTLGVIVVLYEAPESVAANLHGWADASERPATGVARILGGQMGARYVGGGFGGLQ
jgi:hypothetical protein